MVAIALVAVLSVACAPEEESGWDCPPGSVDGGGNVGCVSADPEGDRIDQLEDQVRDLEDDARCDELRQQLDESMSRSTSGSLSDYERSLIRRMPLGCTS